MKKISTCLVLLLILSSFAFSQEVARDRKMKIRIQAGVSYSGILGITEFTDMEYTQQDAFSVSTKTGFSGGAHVAIPVLKQAFETGIDFIYSSQKLAYNDNFNRYKGDREVTNATFVLPLVYSIPILQRKSYDGLAQIKIGAAAEFNLLNFTDSQDNMPWYTWNYYSVGPLLGVSALPFRFGNGSKIGVFVDAFRGTPLYQDLYNPSEFPKNGTTFYKGGIIFQL